MSFTTRGPSLLCRPRGDRIGKWAVIINEGDAPAQDVAVSLRNGAEDCTLLLAGDVPGTLAPNAHFELRLSNLFTSGVLTIRWSDARGKGSVWHGPLTR